MEVTPQTEFESTWTLWYHHQKNNWKLQSYKKIYTIKTIEDFWKLFNNWNKIGGILNQHYFLMRDDIGPIWEDNNNKNGGCWSYKKQNGDIFDLWTDLSVYMLGENLSSNPKSINGISVCLKNDGYSVIKIWNKSSLDNSLSNLNHEILKKWGMDLMYMAHIPEK
jgi:translation initiation factor 4E